jgi:ornithine cyclodeaminase/alanine dehydrogenase-like protein (mu-crystallin family)
MAALYLTEVDVQQLIDMPLAIDCVREAFRQLGLGEADNVPRVRARAPGVVLHSLCAAVSSLGVVGWKVYTTTRDGAQFLVGLHDSVTGRCEALIEADWLGQLRTGATTGVAVEWLAHPRASEVGVFGAGRQARTQLEAVAAVRPLSMAYVYSRTAANRQKFADEMSARLDIEVRPVDRPQEAAEELPIVVTATSSATPVFDGQCLAEGALVCAIGSNWATRAEVDSHVVRRADNIVCDSVKACRLEAGDFVGPLESGVFDWNRAVDLADVVNGTGVGRNNRDSIVLFKSVGLAIEDVALAAKLLELARANGVGQALPF